MFYYKLNGTDQFKGEDGKWYTRDASNHGMDGLSNAYGDNTSELRYVTLDSPVAIN